MTFNTTSLPLRRVLYSKRLLERIPAKPLGDSVRHVLVTPDIDAMLDGRAEFGNFPQVEADKLIAVFSANWRVTVSRKKREPKSKVRPDLEKIEGHSEVWAICPRKPAPGWRILGRFYEKNVFVASRAWDKHVLAKRYDAAAQEVLDDWQELFGSRAAYSGNTIADYIGEAFVDVDQTN